MPGSSERYACKSAIEASTHNVFSGSCHTYNAHGRETKSLPACMRAAAQYGLLFAWVNNSTS